MNKSAKIMLISFLSLFGIVLASFFWVVHLSPNARLAKENVKNSEQLELFMSKEQVLEIMGQPQAEKSNTFYYLPPFAASDGIRVEFDSTERVIFIQLYEPT